MSSNENSTQPCITETPVQHKKRTPSVASVSSFSSVKRRRISRIGDDFNIEPDEKNDHTLHLFNSVDRFISQRPKSAVPLNITPRTYRVSQSLGLAHSRVLSFKENKENIQIPAKEGGKMYHMLRRSASSLFSSPPPLRLSSVTENLNKKKQCTLMLDGPGIPNDPYAFPLAWSKKNLIAVACDTGVFYQNLDTRAVSRLCKLGRGFPGELSVVEWAGMVGQEYRLALGTAKGVVQIWDANQGSHSGTFFTSWRDDRLIGVGGMDWHGNLLAVGSYDGTLSIFDVRSKKEAGRTSLHKDRVMGVKWKLNGSMLASGDELGMVHIWDGRAGKQLLGEDTQKLKMRHGGPVKALAWCAWKPDLLATGSLSPEGKIRVWNSLSLSTIPTPTETLSLNTSVFSLHWSPHCKELLSTHGPSFEPPLAPSRRRSTSGSDSTKPKIIITPLTNAIAVHSYPSCERLLALSSAHFGPVTHSSLGPDGEDLFTVCAKEETVKQWHVWSKRMEMRKGESAFKKWSIR